MGKDLRFAIRGMLKTPGFTAAAVLALALGIGATTAIFSVVHAVLMKSLGWGEESRLISVQDTYPKRGILHGTLSPPEALDLRSVPQFESSGGFADSTSALQGERAERVPVGQATAGFFEALGIHPAYGRTWTPEEDMKGKSGVTLISAPAWHRRYGGDPAAVGRSVTLDGQLYRIIGVLPEGFSYHGPHEFFVPFGFPADKLPKWRGAHWLESVARLKPGVTMEGAQRALDDLSTRLQQQYPNEYTPEVGWKFGFQPLRDRFVGKMREPLFVLFGAVLLVLLIACANVANLLLARSAAREREFAVRAAIGASRARLIRQLLTEGLVMAAAGTILGVLIAGWGLDALMAAAPRQVKELTDVRISRAVLAFSIVLTFATTLIFALAPALRASRVDLANALKDGAHGTQGAPAARLRSLLVAGQVAISVVLLAGAGLMVRSFAAILDVSPGFDPEGVMSAEMIPGGPAYDNNDDALARYYREGMRVAQGLPGAQAASGVDVIPLSNSSYSLTFFAEGYEKVPGEAPISAEIRRPLPGYFAAVHQKILAGREFTLSDDAKAPPVAMVNQAWVRRFFPGKDVVGHRMRLDSDKHGEWRTIVGVVDDARELALDRPAPPVYYFPALQVPPEQMTLVVRGSVNVQELRKALSDIDLTQPLDHVRPLSDVLASSLTPRKFPLQLLGAFALLALLLAALGIYGVTAYSVAQRTREIGLRMAVGASAAGIVRMVLAASLRVVLLGLLTDALAALALGQVLAAQLYGVTPRDPLTLLATSLVLALIAVIASGLPALRAARIDPMAALRAE